MRAGFRAALLLGVLTLGGPAAAGSDLAKLGERLFDDPRLSRSGAVSCRSCHDPARAWADGRTLPVGEDGHQGRRNTPTLLGAGQRTTWRWDGRHATLAEAAVAPLTDPAEQGNPDIDTVLARLTATSDYPPMTAATLAEALAAFVAEIDEPTRFERYTAGDGAALTEQEIRGLGLFQAKAGCAECHSGPRLTDERFHNLRLSSFGEASEDLGRFRTTGDPADAGRFRTPSLRHVGRTAPYMHNGLFRTLEGVVNLYARGGGEVRAAHQPDADRPLFREAARLDPLIHPLDLTAEEKAALVAFLKAL